MDLFMLVKPLIFFGFIALVTWIIAGNISMKALKDIKSLHPEKYQIILGNKKESWIERGYHGPMDFGIAVRLCKLMYYDDMSDTISRNKKKIFFFCLFFSIGYMFLFMITSIAFVYVVLNR